MDIDITLDVERAAQNLSEIAERQLPFTAAQAVTGMAKAVQQAETAALPEVFDHPTPFTMRAFGLTAARKGNPEATVFAKDRQAAYLEPSEIQGFQFLGAGKRIRTPVDARTNQYGNLPKGTIARLVGRKGYFIGVVKGVNGLWRRVKGHRLKLLVAFTRPVEVKSDLEFGKRAERVVNASFSTIFRDALEKALRTAK